VRRNRLREREKKTRLRVEKYVEFVQVIRAPFSLGSLDRTFTEEEK
jgi:hypothetical protein